MDDFMILVLPGGYLPEPGKVFKTESLIAGVTQKIKVKRINSLRWTKKGQLVIEITGTLRG